MEDQSPIVLKIARIVIREEPYVPHPLAGLMAQNKPAAAKEKRGADDEDILTEKSLWAM